MNNLIVGMDIVVWRAYFFAVCFSDKNGAMVWVEQLPPGWVYIFCEEIFIRYNTYFPGHFSHESVLRFTIQAQFY